MNIVMAKVGKEFKNVLSKNIDIVDEFHINSSSPFAPSYKLEEDEWYRLDNFLDTNFFTEECKDDFSTVNLNQISNSEYEKVVCVSIFQNRKKYFYRITPSLYINKKFVLDYSGDPKIVKYKKQIEIKNEPDAIYDSENDALYFKHIGKIKLIFPGIEELHREATQEEVDDFISSDFIKLDGIQSQLIGVLNRKRIADIGNKFNRLSNDKKIVLVQYAKDKAGLELEEDKLVVKNDKDLKNLLFALDQRYYYADVYEENRVANSVKIVEKE